MAAITWYATNNLASNSSHQEMSETDPGTEAYASPVTGWVVSTGATNRSKFEAQTERAATTFDATTYPNGTIDTALGDCLRSATAYNGSFASANWVVHFESRANSNGGAQDGRMYCRLFRSANEDGSSATEITSAAQQGTLVSNLATSATLDSAATFNPGAFSVSNEYLFVQLAWERTGAGGMTSSDVNMRIGNAGGHGTRVVTSDFAQITEGSTNATLGAVTSAATGTVDIQGAAAVTLGAVTSSAVGGVDVQGSASATLGALSVSGTGTVEDAGVSGSLSVTLGELTQSGVGTVDVQGATSASLQALSSSATGSVHVAGTTAATLDAVTSSATGTVEVQGLTSASLGPVSVAGTGTLAVAGSLAKDLGSVTTSAAGSVEVQGTAGVTLGPLLLDGAGGFGSQPTEGSLSLALGSLVCSATGNAEVMAELTAALGDLSLVSSGLLTEQMEPVFTSHSIAHVPSAQSLGSRCVVPLSTNNSSKAIVP